MNLRKLASQVLPPLLVPSAWFGNSSFESANDSDRRSDVPGTAPTDAYKELTRWVRSELVRKSRYLHKNSGFIRELVGNMAIYSTGVGIRVQAKTVDKAWNREAEEYFAAWSNRCEVTGRFSFAEVQGLVCRAMDVDGEIFVHKTRDRFKAPKLQLIETHRVGTKYPADDMFEDGIRVDRYGAPISYRINEDGDKTRDIPASAILHIHEPETAGSRRAFPTMQHSINNVLDELELLALEKHGVKDNVDVSRVLKSERGTIDDNGDFQLGGVGTGDSSDAPSLQKIIGGKLVKLNPGESLESFNPSRPSPTFTGFLEHLRRDASLGVLPYEFAADSSRVGGAGVRLIVAKADRRFAYRQMILKQRLIRPTWFYVIGDAIANGTLDAPDGWWKVGTVAPRRITVDAGREAQQNRADVEAGLKTISEHYSEMGSDFEEELERRAEDARMILEKANELGVPVEMLWNPARGGVQESTR